MALTFLHPHTNIQVNDNSTTFETAAGGGTTLFMPYLSDKGEDRKLEEINDLNTFLTQKGFPNFKRHGQAIYNVVQWLRGGGRVFGIRLTAEDATYSNTVLNIKTRPALVPVYKKKADGTYEKDSYGNRIPEMESDDITPKTRPGVEVKLAAETFKGLVDKTQIVNLLDGVPKTDDEGFQNHHIAAMTLKGRGTYGDKYSYRLSLNTSFEDTYDFRVYDMTVMEKTANGNLRVAEGPVQVSLFPEALTLGGSSMFIGQVMKNYFTDTDFTFNEKAYDQLIDDIMEATKDEDSNYTIDDPKVLDLLFGRDKNNQLDEIFNVLEGLKIDHFEGVSFESGDDGKFGTKVQAKERSEALQQALIGAYTGSIDRAVLNRKQFPIQIALDANFPLPVKQAIAQFCRERQDTFGIGDTGILPSPAAAVAWRSNEFQESSYYYGIFGQSYTVYDTFTSQDIPVTATYILASKIPQNDNDFGIQFPFVGPTRGLITGIKNLDWNPDEYEKEDLYKARVNYAEQDYRTTKFMSQNTSQYKTSALSNINNVRVLMEMIRAVDNLSEGYKFEFPNQATLNSFNQELTSVMSQWISNGACSTASATAYQNAYDQEQKIARVRIDVVFNNVIERIVIEFNVGRA